MSVPQIETGGGYSLNRGKGDAIWFNGGLIEFKATAELTGGRFTILELTAPKGFAAPLHIHRNEDEFFLVLDGDVRLQHGEKVIEAESGTLVWGPRDVPHSFHVDSEEARMMLMFGPAGVEGFFRDAGKVARSFGLPPADEEFPLREVLMEIAGHYSQEFVGPPLPPK